MALGDWHERPGLERPGLMGGGGGLITIHISGGKINKIHVSRGKKCFHVSYLK